MKKEKKEKIVDLEKRNNMQRKMINVLLIVFFVLIGVSAYLVLNDERFFKVDIPDEEEEEEIPVIENNHTDMEVSYFENLLNGTIDVNCLEEGFNNIDELSNQQKLSLLFYSSNDYISEMEEINIEIVNNYFKNNYGTMVEHENISCDMNSIEEEYCYIYDEENEIYIENFIDEEQKKEILSNYMNRNVYGKITDYNQENNTYTFIRYELYKPSCYNDCNLSNEFFSDVRSANNSEKILIALSEEYTIQDIIDYNVNKLYALELETNFVIYQNLMTSHTYTFKKVDDSYILQSYQINRLD